MLKINTPIQLILAMAGLLALVSASITLVSFGMALSNDGSMGSCPFAPEGSLCAMSFQEHMNLWKLAFTALPQKTATINFVLVAILLVAAVFLNHTYLLYYRWFWASHIIHNDIIDPVRRALHKGIINPKIF